MKIKPYILKPVACAIVFSFIFQDIVWANPDIGTPAANALQVPTRLKPDIGDESFRTMFVRTTIEKILRSTDIDKFNYNLTRRLRGPLEGVYFGLDLSLPDKEADKNTGKTRRGDGWAIPFVLKDLVNDREWRYEVFVRDSHKTADINELPLQDPVFPMPNEKAYEYPRNGDGDGPGMADDMLIKTHAPAIEAKGAPQSGPALERARNELNRIARILKWRGVKVKNPDGSETIKDEGAMTKVNKDLGKERIISWNVAWPALAGWGLVFFGILAMPTPAGVVFIGVGGIGIIASAVMALRKYNREKRERPMRVEVAISDLLKGVTDVERELANAGISPELLEGLPIPVIEKYLNGAAVKGAIVKTGYEPLMGKVAIVSLLETVRSSKKQLERLASDGIERGVISFDAAGNICEGVAINPKQEYEFLRSSRTGPPGILNSIVRRVRGDQQFNGIELEVAKLYRAIKMAEVVSGEADIVIAQEGVVTPDGIRQTIEDTKKKHGACLEEMINANETLRSSGLSAYEYPLIKFWITNIVLIFIPVFIMYLAAPYALTYLDIVSETGVLGGIFMKFIKLLDDQRWIIPYLGTGSLLISFVNFIYKDLYLSPAGLISARRVMNIGGKKVMVRGSVVNATDEEIADFQARPGAELPSYIVALPAFGEPRIIKDLIDTMAALDYPKDKIEFVLLTESSDTDPRPREKISTMGEIISKLMSDPKKYSNFRVLTSPIRVLDEHNQSKPYSTNYILGLVKREKIQGKLKGKYLVIYDAEDRPYPLQIKQAAVAFENRSYYLKVILEYFAAGGNIKSLDPELARKAFEYRFDLEELASSAGKEGADKAFKDYSSKHRLGVLQAPLTWYNPTTLTGLQFIVDYNFWFGIVLPGLEYRKLPVPHGGTSNHFLVDTIVEIGGWDPHNVTEDFLASVAIQSAGYESLMLHSVTAEEAPERQVRPDKWEWVRQHSRWGKGYLQTFLVLMRNPAKWIRTLGLRKFTALFFLAGIGTYSYLFNVIFISNTVLWGISNLIVMGPAWSISALTFTALLIWISTGMKSITKLAGSVAAITAINIFFYGVVGSLANYYTMAVPAALPVIPWLGGILGIRPYFVGVMLLTVPTVMHVLYSLAAVKIGVPHQDFAIDTTIKELTLRADVLQKKEDKDDEETRELAHLRWLVERLEQDKGFYKKFLYAAALFMPIYRSFSLLSFCIGFGQFLMGKPFYWDKTEHQGRGSDAVRPKEKAAKKKLDSFFTDYRYRFARFFTSREPRFFRLEWAALAFAVFVSIFPLAAPIRYIKESLTVDPGSKITPSLYSKEQMEFFQGVSYDNSHDEENTRLTRAYYAKLVSAYKDSPGYLKGRIFDMIEKFTKGPRPVSHAEEIKLCILAYLELTIDNVDSETYRRRAINEFLEDLRISISSYSDDPIIKTSLERKFDIITGRLPPAPKNTPGFLIQHMGGDVFDFELGVAGWRIFLLDELPKRKLKFPEVSTKNNTNKTAGGMILVGLSLANINAVGSEWLNIFGVGLIVLGAALILSGRLRQGVKSFIKWVFKPSDLLTGMIELKDPYKEDTAKLRESIRRLQEIGEKFKKEHDESVAATALLRERSKEHKRVLKELRNGSISIRLIIAVLAIFLLSATVALGESFTYYGSGRMESKSVNPADGYNRVYYHFTDENYYTRGYGRVDAEVLSTADSAGAIGYRYEYSDSARYNVVVGDGSTKVTNGVTHAFVGFGGLSHGSIQTAVDEVFAAGGGIVALRGGNYGLNGEGIVLKDGVRLLGGYSTSGERDIASNTTSIVNGYVDIVGPITKDTELSGFDIHYEPAFTGKKRRHLVGVDARGGLGRAFVINNTLTANVDLGFGIEAVGSVSQFVIFNNTISGGLGRFFWAGIHVADGADGRIEFNRLSTSYGAGVTVNGSITPTKAVIQNNMFTNNGSNPASETHVLFFDAFDTFAWDNTFVGGDTAVTYKDSDNTKIENNILSGQTGQSITLIGSPSAYESGNITGPDIDPADYPLKGYSGNRVYWDRGSLGYKKYAYSYASTNNPSIPQLTGLVYTYEYDSDGRIIKETNETNGNYSVFVSHWEGTGAIKTQKDYDSSGTPLRRIDYGPDSKSIIDYQSGQIDQWFYEWRGYRKLEWDGSNYRAHTYLDDHLIIENDPGEGIKIYNYGPNWTNMGCTRMYEVSPTNGLGTRIKEEYDSSWNLVRRYIWNRPFHVGVNLPWLDYGKDIGRSRALVDPPTQKGLSTKRATLDENMRQLAGTVCRPFVLCDLRSGIKTDGLGNITGFDEDAVSDLRELLNAAQANGVKLVLTLFDYSLAEGITGVTYDNGHGTITQPFGEYRQFVTDPVKRSQLKDAVLGLFNDVQLSRYSCVIGFDLMNEPEWSRDGIYLGDEYSYDQAYEGVAQADLESFLAYFKDALHANYPGKWVTVGHKDREELAGWPKTDDVYQFHYYDWMGTSTNHSPLGSVTAAQLGLNGPVFAGELEPTDVTNKLNTLYNGGYSMGLFWRDDSEYPMSTNTLNTIKSFFIGTVQEFPAPGKVINNERSLPDKGTTYQDPIATASVPRNKYTFDGHALREELEIATGRRQPYKEGDWNYRHPYKYLFTSAAGGIANLMFSAVLGYFAFQIHGYSGTLSAILSVYAFFSLVDALFAFSVTLQTNMGRIPFFGKFVKSYTKSPVFRKAFTILNSPVSIAHETGHVVAGILVGGRLVKFSTTAVLIKMSDERAIEPRHVIGDSINIRYAIQIIKAKTGKAGQAFLELIKFCMVGGSGVVVDMAVVVALREIFGLDVRVDALFGFAAAVTTNYILNRYWTFKEAAKTAFVKGYVRFVVTCCAGLAARLAAMQLIIMAIPAVSTGKWYMLTNFIGIIVGTGVNFIGSKLFVFKSKEQGGGILSKLRACFNGWWAPLMDHVFENHREDNIWRPVTIKKIVVGSAATFFGFFFNRGFSETVIWFGLAWIALVIAHNTITDMAAKKGWNPFNWKAANIGKRKLANDLFVSGLSSVVIIPALSFIPHVAEFLGIASLVSVMPSITIIPSFLITAVGAASQFEIFSNIIAVTLVGGALNYYTRLWRRCSKKTAKTDFWRSPVMSIGGYLLLTAVLLFNSAIPSVYSIAFFVIARKLIGEIYAGFSEWDERKEVVYENSPPDKAMPIGKGGGMKFMSPLAGSDESGMSDDLAEEPEIAERSVSPVSRKTPVKIKKKNGIMSKTYPGDNLAADERLRIATIMAESFRKDRPAEKEDFIKEPNFQLKRSDIPSSGVVYIFMFPRMLSGKVVVKDGVAEIYLYDGSSPKAVLSDTVILGKDGFPVQANRAAVPAPAERPKPEGCPATLLAEMHGREIYRGNSKTMRDLRGFAVQKRKTGRSYNTLANERNILERAGLLFGDRTGYYLPDWLKDIKGIEMFINDDPELRLLGKAGLSDDEIDTVKARTAALKLLHGKKAKVKPLVSPSGFSADPRNPGRISEFLAAPSTGGIFQAMDGVDDERFLDYFKKYDDNTYEGDHDTRNANISKVMNGLKNKRTVLVFGCGTLDQSVLKDFDRIVLVDLNENVLRSAWKRQPEDIRKKTYLVKTDVSWMAAPVIKKMKEVEGANMSFKEAVRAILEVMDKERTIVFPDSFADLIILERTDYDFDHSLIAYAHRILNDKYPDKMTSARVSKTVEQMFKKRIKPSQTEQWNRMLKEGGAVYLSVLFGVKTPLSNKFFRVIETFDPFFKEVTAKGFTDRSKELPTKVWRWTEDPEHSPYWSVRGIWLEKGIEEVVGDAPELTIPAPAPPSQSYFDIRYPVKLYSEDRVIGIQDIRDPVLLKKRLERNIYYANAPPERRVGMIKRVSELEPIVLLLKEYMRLHHPDLETLNMSVYGSYPFGDEDTAPSDADIMIMVKGNYFTGGETIDVSNDPAFTGISRKFPKVSLYIIGAENLQEGKIDGRNGATDLEKQRWVKRQKSVCENTATVLYRRNVVLEGYDFIENDAIYRPGLPARVYDLLYNSYRRMFLYNLVTDETEYERFRIATTRIFDAAVFLNDMSEDASMDLEKFFELRKRFEYRYHEDPSGAKNEVIDAWVKVSDEYTRLLSHGSVVSSGPKKASLRDFEPVVPSVSSAEPVSEGSRRYDLIDMHTSRPGVASPEESSFYSYGLRDLTKDKEMVRNMVEKILSAAWNEKIVLVFDEELGSKQSVKNLRDFKRVIEELKKDPNLAKLLRNVIIKLNVKAAEAFANQSDTEVFIFTSKKDGVPLASNVHAAVIDEKDFPMSAYYPLAEIVTITLARFLEPDILPRAVAMARDLNISSITEADGGLVFTLLPSAKEYEVQELVRRYARLKELLRNA